MRNIHFWISYVLVCLLSASAAFELWASTIGLSAAAILTIADGIVDAIHGRATK